MSDELVIETLVTKLIGDDENYNQTMENAARTAEQTAERIIATGVAEGVLGAKAIQKAGEAIIGTVHEMVGAWEEQEQANIMLEATLKAQGREVEATMHRYEEFAGQMQANTTMADEQVIMLLKQAEAFELTGDAAEKATEDAVALAAIEGTSASSMMRLTAAMTEGNLAKAKLFARWIPELRGVKDETEFVARYQKLIEAGLEANTKLTATFGGQMKQLGNAVSDLYEDFGKTIAEVMTPFVALLKDAVNWMKGLSDETKKWITIIGGAAVASVFGVVVKHLFNAIPFLRILGISFKAIFLTALSLISPIGIVVALVAGALIGAVVVLVNRLGGVHAAWEKIKEAGLAFYRTIQPIILQLGFLFSAVWEVVRDTAVALFNNIADVLTSAWEAITGNVADSWASVTQTVLDSLILIEFAMRHLGESGAIVWMTIRLRAMQEFNNLLEFFGLGVDRVQERLLALQLSFTNAAFGAAFGAFREQRMAELQAIMDGVGDASERTRRNFDGMAGAADKTKDKLHKTDAALVNSAEGIARVMKYLEGDNMGKGKDGKRDYRDVSHRDQSHDDPDFTPRAGRSFPFGHTSWDDAEADWIRRMKEQREELEGFGVPSSWEPGGNFGIGVPRPDQQTSNATTVERLDTLIERMDSLITLTEQQSDNPIIEIASADLT